MSDYDRDAELTLLREKIAVWSRENTTYNDVVWNDIDTLFNRAIYEAKKEKCFEAFTYLTTLYAYITRERITQLKAELSVVMKSP